MNTDYYHLKLRYDAEKTEDALYPLEKCCAEATETQVDGRTYWTVRGRNYELLTPEKLATAQAKTKCNKLAVAITVIAVIAFLVGIGIACRGIVIQDKALELAGRITAISGFGVGALVLIPQKFICEANVWKVATHNEAEFIRSHKNNPVSIRMRAEAERKEDLEAPVPDGLLPEPLCYGSPETAAFHVHTTFTHVVPAEELDHPVQHLEKLEQGKKTAFKILGLGILSYLLLAGIGIGVGVHFKMPVVVACSVGPFPLVIAIFAGICEYKYTKSMKSAWIAWRTIKAYRDMGESIAQAALDRCLLQSASLRALENPVRLMFDALGSEGEKKRFVAHLIAHDYYVQRLLLQSGFRAYPESFRDRILALCEQFPITV